MITWRADPTVISCCTKLSGSSSVTQVKFRSFGCFGLLAWRRRLVVRTIDDILGMLDKGASAGRCLCTASFARVDPEANGRSFPCCRT